MGEEKRGDFFIYIRIIGVKFDIKKTVICSAKKVN